MATFISRLKKADGQLLEVGKPWPEEVNAPNFNVGLIIERAELAVQDDEGAVETTSAHYEVWLMPDPLREEFYKFFIQAFTPKAPPPPTESLSAAMAKVPNVSCRKVWRDQVVYTEEIVNILEAFQQIEDFFSQKLTPDEPPAEKQDPPAQQPQAST